MAVKASGTLSFDTDIVGEFKGSRPHSLSEYYAGGTLVNAGTKNAAGNTIPSSGSIKFSDFYGASSSITVYAYGIGAGGRNSNDTNGGGGGGGAVVKKLQVSGPITLVVGAAPGYSSPGGDSTLTHGSTVLIAHGGFGAGGKQGGVDCGGCWNHGSTSRDTAGGTATGGDLNLTGGFGSAFNRDNPNGGPGASGVLDGMTFYAAGGGAGGQDGRGRNNGSPGGSLTVGGVTFTAGTGGSAKFDEVGGAGGNYGGGAGGSGNYNKGNQGAGKGAWLLFYTSDKQLLNGGSVTSSGSGAAKVWAHVIESNTTVTVLT